MHFGFLQNDGETVIIITEHPLHILSPLADCHSTIISKTLHLYRVSQPI